MTLRHTLPRVVLVTRKTPLELLIARHGTQSQARFYLESRNERIGDYEEAHDRLNGGVARVLEAIPEDQRRVRVERDELHRFLFAPDDIVCVVGQDGLVPNVAKCLTGQLVLGINPDPDRYDGVLCRHAPEAAERLLTWTSERTNLTFRIERRTMAVAQREDGQSLLALNEIFVGHQSHQSARYRIVHTRGQERHSSSGIICSTGTGATGWVRSICEQRGIEHKLPGPEDPRLAWFVREPFPSVNTGTSLTFGILGRKRRLEVISEMGEGGVAFADGIESDRLEFLTGQTVAIKVSKQTLNLVMPADTRQKS